jgi:hypothetical protein
MEPDYALQEFPKEEADALTKELQDVLAKYNGEMGVTSTINLMKRVPKAIPSPFVTSPHGESAPEDKTSETPKAD